MIQKSKFRRLVWHEMHNDDGFEVKTCSRHDCWIKKLISRGMKAWPITESLEQNPNTITGTKFILTITE